VTVNRVSDVSYEANKESLVGNAFDRRLSDNLLSVNYSHNAMPPFREEAQRSVFVLKITLLLRYT
jgi:hypothetical protein